MMSSYDIFKLLPDGTVRWIEATATLDDAKQRIEQITPSSPGEYVIVNQNTGNRFFLKPEPQDVQHHR